MTNTVYTNEELTKAVWALFSGLKASAEAYMILLRSVAELENELYDLKGLNR